MTSRDDYRAGRWVSAGVGAYVNRVHTMVGVQAHRGYRGWVARRIEGTRHDERQPCGHFHQKQGAARRCAETTARRLNRATR